jgi:RHH-type proline utilization regulon transcriptional repressor/proline dehydrogenase/delta 1-pyrroline-5-carboxylate dehydrogenase
LEASDRAGANVSAALDPAAGRNIVRSHGFRPSVSSRTALRQHIRAHHRIPEREWVLQLADEAELSEAQREQAADLARSLAERVRTARRAAGGVDALMHEFSLSSSEGVALMCLAEALLRVPDVATRDRLIRDKIGPGDWSAHLGQSPSLFVNAAAWGLLITGKLVPTHSESSLGATLRGLLGRGGAPVIRRATDLAIRMLGRQFVTGETIAEALDSAKERERRGYRFSYDMLGEAALTATDADRYLRAYEDAVRAIGQASAGRGILGPGISIKLSALHPRYARAQRDRVMSELLPCVRSLALLAKSYGIGLNIDAEEQDRLDLSLDILGALATDPELSGWDGLGFVVQAYGRRARPVIDWLIDLGRRTGRRLMIRLVKGAYWDSEIKLAQVGGFSDYPVFTRNCTPTFRTWPARSGCSRRRTPSFRNSRPTTPTRSGRSEPWRAMPAMSFSACTAWARRSTMTWCAPAYPAASTRQSARTRPFSLIWSAACSRTAPTRPSSARSSTRLSRSRRSSPTRSRGRAGMGDKQTRPCRYRRRCFRGG